MEAIIQDLDRYFQHARRTKLNTFASAGVMSNNASKAIKALKSLLEHPEYAEDQNLLHEIISGLSKAAGIYEKYCESLDSKWKGNDQLFSHLNHTLYTNLKHFLQAFYHVD